MAETKTDKQSDRCTSISIRYKRSAASVSGYEEETLWAFAQANGYCSKRSTARTPIRRSVLKSDYEIHESTANGERIRAIMRKEALRDGAELHAQTTAAAINTTVMMDDKASGASEEHVQLM